jgi:HEAT repeat protein
VTDEVLRQSIAENCRRIHVNRRPELRISSKPGSPCLIGILRPVIVLPTSILESCSAAALNAALLHELAHLKRRDLWWNWLPVLSEVLFFFNPLVWLARREWRLVQEIATDELALSVARVDVAQYAEWLLELVAKCRMTTIHPHLALGVSETFSQLSRRMSAMQSFQKLTTRRRVAFGAAIFIIAIGGIVPWKLTRRDARGQSNSDAARQSTDDARPSALQIIEKRGGTFYRDQNRPDKPVISVSFSDKSQAVDADLKCLKDIPNLVELNLKFPALSDDGLEHLKSLTSLGALSIVSSKVTNAGVAQLAALTKLEILELEHAQIDDEGLARLKDLTRMDLLNLTNTGISDKGLEHLQGMSKLHTLILDGTRTSDAGLEVVGKLISLSDLRLRDTRISDAGLEHLKRLTRVQTLVLNGSKITDAGLEHLKGLKSLTTLCLDIDANVTDEAVKKLKDALPGCTIQENRSPERAAPASAVKSEKSVDELIEEFSKAESTWKQADVAQRLVEVADKSIIPWIEKLLDTPDRGRRCNAALMLARLGDERGLAIIIGELQDTTPRPTNLKKSDGRPDSEGQIRQDRYYAALLLGKLGKTEAVPALMQATTDKSINYQAAISLGEIGDKSAVPALRKMAADFPDQRLWAGYALAAVGEPEGFEILDNVALSDRLWTERRHAVEALGKIGNPKTLRTLTKALQDEHVNVRVSAAIALGKIGDPGAIPALTAGLNDTETTQVNAPTTYAAEARKAILAIKQRQSNVVQNRAQQTPTPETLEKWLEGKEWIEVSFGGPHMDPLALRDSLKIKGNLTDFRLTPGEGGRPGDRGGAFIEVGMKVTPENTRLVLALQTELSSRGYVLEGDRARVWSYQADPNIREQARQLVPQVLANLEQAIKQAVPNIECTAKERRDAGYLGGFEYVLPGTSMKGWIRFESITSPVIGGAIAPDQTLHLPHLGLIGWNISGLDANAPQRQLIRQAFQDSVEPLLKLEPGAAVTLGHQPAAARAKPDSYQGIIAARPAPELSTLVARSSPEDRGPDATESFWDLLKLREAPDPKAVPVLEKILVENLSSTRIHRFAAAQALFAIGTPEAHQILAKYLLVDDAWAKLAIFYTSHWEMREPLRSRFIDRYSLQNLSKSLVVEVEQVAPAKVQIGLVVVLRNTSDQAFHILDDQSGDFLNVRDAGGRFLPDRMAMRHGPKPQTAFVELKPGQDHRIPFTIKVTDAAKSTNPLHDPSARLIAEVAQSGQRFELETAGRVEVVAMIEAQPLSPEQRKLMKVDDTWHWWSGRAVSKPLKVELSLP